MESRDEHLLRSLSWLRGIAVMAAATISVPALSQQAGGVLVVSRDVPERYAFLPGSGKATTVNTAPFVEVWGDIDPGQPIPDAAASGISAKTTGPASALQVLTTGAGVASHMDISSGAMDKSGAQSPGVGAVVGQTIDSGMNALHSGLDQIQSAVRAR